VGLLTHRGVSPRFMAQRCRCRLGAVPFPGALRVRISRVAALLVRVAQLPRPWLMLGGGYLVQPLPALGLRGGQAAVLLREENGARRTGAILLDVSRQVVVFRPLIHHRLPYLRRSAQSTDILGANELNAGPYQPSLLIAGLSWSASGRYRTARLLCFLAVFPTAVGA
jgi:hypothetical protein